MTDAALQDLWARLHELRETLVHLRLTAVEDRPDHDRTLFSDELAAAVDDVCGVVAEAVDAAGAALATGDPAALDDVHRALSAARRRYGQVLGTPVAHAELERLRTHDQAWGAWVQALRLDAGGAPAAFHHTDDAVRAAWRALAERAPTTSLRQGGTR